MGGHVAFMERMAQNLSTAATGLAEEMAGARSRRGRKPVQGAYAGFIASIAHAVKDDGIKPSRAGKFLKISCEIFEAAGVHPLPDGAIRFFIETGWAEDMRARGLCL